MFNGVSASTSNSLSQQNDSFFTLFACNGSTGMTADLSKILGYYENASDVELTTSKNMMFHYGVLEVGFTNRSTTAQAIVEVYEWKIWKNVTSYVTPTALYLNAVADEEILGEPVVSANAITLLNLGASPYQVPGLCKNMKFEKKTSFLLQLSGTGQYVMARKKNRWLTGQKVVDNTSFAIEGWTEGVLLVYRGPPQTGTTAVSVTLDLMQNRKYSWRAMDPHAKNDYAQETY